MNKRILAISTIAIVAAAVVPALSFAQIPSAIVHDVRNNQIKSTNGNCVYTLYGDHDEQCGGAMVAEPAAAPEAAHKRLASVYFDFNKSDLNRRGKATLDKLLAQLRHDKVEAVTIAGFADAIGSDSYNMKLSKKRAEAVQKYLNSHGFKHTDTDLRALGKRDAEASCKGLKDGKLHACMQEDRRVDIELSVVKK